MSIHLLLALHKSQTAGSSKSHEITCHAGTETKRIETNLTCTVSEEKVIACDIYRLAEKPIAWSDHCTVSQVYS